MKYSIVLISIFSSIILLINCNNNKSELENVNHGIKKHILLTNKQFEKQIDSFISQIQSGQNIDQYQKQFDSLRSTFKQMEWAVAFYMPETNRFMNGPNLDEIEFEESTVLEAEGLQTLEEFFYPNYAIQNKEEVVRFLRKLKNKSLGIDVYFEVNNIDKSQIIEAIRNEVFRITTLGITGFDTPISGKGLLEASYALQGIDTVFQHLKQESTDHSQIDKITTHIKYISKKLVKSPQKDSFDYLTFIDKDLNKLSDLIFEYSQIENIPPLNINSPLHKTASNLFQKDAWNVDFFAPSEAHKINKEKVRLGKTLFSDNILSGNGTRSCQSCHHPTKAFTDGLKTPMNLNNKPLHRNSPSLNYSNFQHGQFWDMSREDLEGQSATVISNEDEMHGSLEDIIKKLNNNSTYKTDFKNIYRTEDIETWQLQNVLASYIRSLSTFNSKFDKYFQGENTALTKDEKDGFNLFVGKAKCATCHFIPLFNGTVPPEYTKTESEVLGTAISTENKKISPDFGRGKYYNTVAQLQHAFKTPSLRNVGLTGPYMHNGAYQTLEELMHFYNEGGGNGFGFNLENQTLPVDKLNLSPDEIRKIILFLHTLTDSQK